MLVPGFAKSNYILNKSSLFADTMGKHVVCNVQTLSNIKIDISVMQRIFL